MDNIILSEWGKKKKSCMEMGLKITNKGRTIRKLMGGGGRAKYKKKIRAREN